MGFRFRKSFKIAPGVRVNVGKKSVGISAGVKGARVSVNSKGRVTKTVGIPGTGLSYTDTSTLGKGTAAPRTTQQPTVSPQPIQPVTHTPAVSQTKASNTSAKLLKVLAPILCVMAAILMLASPIAGAILYLIGVYLSTVPATYQTQQNHTAPIPIFKRKGVIIALVVGVLWLILCRSI